MKSIPLVLASTSPYRKEVLSRLQVPFATFAPNIDETPRPEESPHALVQRLAEEKARAAAEAHPAALIIGSDQMSVIDGEILGKPHTHDRAVAQLRKASGRQVDFVTGLCLYHSAEDRARTLVDSYGVVFRTLSDAFIEQYLRKEQPYHCAGSFKSEGLGIVLLKKMVGTDPTTVIGLPLIRLIELLEAENFPILP